MNSATTQTRIDADVGAWAAPSASAGRRSKLATARVAGILYLAIIAFGLFAEVVVRPGTADRLGGRTGDRHEYPRLRAPFRMGFAADVVVFLCDVALAVVLYFLFAPLSKVVSMLAAAFRLTQTAIIGLNLLSMFGALLVLQQADYLGAFSTGESESLASLFLDMHKYGYTLGLTFFGASTMLIGYLAYRSGVVPRLLSGLLVFAGIGYVGDSAAFFLVPGYEGSISPILLAPAIVGEIWFAFWLLLKGHRLDERSENANEPNEPSEVSA